MKKRFSEEQIIGFLREADRGMVVKDFVSGLEHIGIDAEKRLIHPIRDVRAEEGSESALAARSAVAIVDVST